MLTSRAAHRDVADAQRNGPHVHVGESPSRDRDDPWLAGPEHLFGNLAAGRKAAAGNRVAAARARHLELELSGRGGEHDEPPLGPADLDRRVQHERQHVVEHAAGAERAKPFEERGYLAEVADGGRGGLVLRGRAVGQEEHHLGAATPAEPDAITVDKRPLGDLFAVDVGAISRALVANEELVVLGVDLGVVAGDFAAGQSQVVGFARPISMPFEIGTIRRPRRRSPRGGHRAWIEVCTFRSFRNVTRRSSQNLSAAARREQEDHWRPGRDACASAGGSGVAAVRTPAALSPRAARR
jgi:hypothetical protein